MIKYYCDRCGCSVKTRPDLTAIAAENVNYTFDEVRNREVLGEVCVKCYSVIKHEILGGVITGDCSRNT